VNVGAYAKTIAAILGSALTVAVGQFPHATWIPIATAAITIIGVYAVPNVPGKSGASPVLPAADIASLVGAISTIVKHLDTGSENVAAPAGMASTLPAGSSPANPTIALPGTGDPVPDTDPAWLGTQTVSDDIASDTAFRSFLSRVGGGTTT
jgi:hypothetical protein